MPHAKIIYRYRIWLLAPILALLLFPSPLLWLGFALAPGYFLLRRLARGDWFPATHANFFILMLGVPIALGFVISPARDLGVLTAAMLVAGWLAFMYSVDELNVSQDYTRATRGLVLLGVFVALIAPLTTIPSPEPLLGPLAFAISQATPKLGKSSNPNIVAGGLAILAPFALALLMQKGKQWRALGLVAFPLMVFAILFLESRGALFALALGVAVWLTLYRRWILPLVPLAIIGLLAFNQARQGPSLAQVVYGTIGSPKGGTFIERTVIWAQAAALIRESPLTGIGLGAYPQIAPYAYPYSANDPGRAPNHAHNLFLQVALDAGVIGVGALFALILFALSGAWRTYRVHFERDAAIALLAAFVVLLTHGMGDTVVWGTAKTGVILWLLLGLGISFDKSAQVV